MAAIKLHVFRTEMGDPGIDSCDFRGEGEHGAGQNDQHRTVLEVDPASDELIETVKMYAPAANGMFQAIGAEQPGWLDKVAGVLGLEGSGPIGLRFGIWDQ